MICIRSVNGFLGKRAFTTSINAACAASLGAKPLCSRIEPVYVIAIMYSFAAGLDGSSAAGLAWLPGVVAVPSRYGFRECVIKGFVDEVLILIGSEVIAWHNRTYERGGFVFDPLHYLALIVSLAGMWWSFAP